MHSPATTQPLSRRPHGFTLIELLVVIGIIIVLAAGVVPVVTSLSKSGGRKAALSSLMGALEQARTEAIKSGQSTYIAFPDAIPGGNAALLEQYAYRSYAIFQDDPENPLTPKQLTNWRTLPTGISIRSGSLNYLANTKEFPFTPAGTTAPLRFIKFGPTGEVDAESTPTANTGTIQINIFEGSVSGSGASAKELVTSANKTAEERITLARLTGRASQTP